MDDRGRRRIGRRSGRPHYGTLLAMLASVATVVVLGSSWIAIAADGPTELERQLSSWSRSGAWASSEVWGIVTRLGSPWVLGPAVLVVALWLHRRGDVHLAWMPAAALAATYVLVSATRMGVERARPLAIEAGPQGGSFPSFQAAQAAAFWGLVVLFSMPGRSRRTSIILAIAGASIILLVGASRLVLAVHWPLDIASGWALGAAVACLFALRSRSTLLSADEPLRAVACCHRLGATGPELLLVRSRRGGWTLPGGRVEPGESASAAAERGAREEAGAEGTLAPDPVTWVRMRKRLTDTLRGAATNTPVFMLEVDEAITPEERDREPTWRSLHEAEAALRDGRPPWSSWRVEAAHAAAARLSQPPRRGRAA